MFIDLPEYQIKLQKLQSLLKLQNARTGFVLNKYATCEDMTKLKWLLIPERINFIITKLIFKGLLKWNVLENLEIQTKNSNQSSKTLNKGF